MSSSVARITPLEYRPVKHAAPPVLTLLDAEDSSPDPGSEPHITSVPEEEVKQRVQSARSAAMAETEERLLQETERVRQDALHRMKEALSIFEQDRQAYFKRVEHEIVKLSLAIARKILEREAEMNPLLLAALVRRALERMQCGSSVRVRVAPTESEIWREQGDGKAGAPRWEIMPDSALKPGDCVVETSVGSANFGFDAQLSDVEQSFLQLLAQSPAA